ncbi:hypothetical protein LPJ73_002346 [Coemansia sp. RSA 2703]|nr:hypothetical protein LPJ73_002346 [Coemansia sp. RSA 2703]KAJ2364933.1 hypothetical protein IW150_006352 [Coemansia sp. RSA 2607]
MSRDPEFRKVAQDIEEYLDTALVNKKQAEEGQRCFVDTREAGAFVFRAGAGARDVDSPTTAVFSSRSPVDAGSPYRSSVTTTISAAAGNSLSLPKPPAHAARPPPPRRHTLGSRTLHPTFS